jgi:hypothetical protein
MVRRRYIFGAFAVAAVFGLVTLPVWGMGVAVFLDSTRTVLDRHPSPDGARIAQVERIVVGGVPSIVVIVRSWWMPNWYLAGCVAASHYEEHRRACILEVEQLFGVADQGRCRRMDDERPIQEQSL